MAVELLVQVNLCYPYYLGVVYNLIQVVQMLAYLLAEMLDGLFNWGDNLL